MTGCWTYCEHGGICELPAGHEGLHDTRYCKFSDEQAVSKDAADAALINKDPLTGRSIVLLSDTFRAIADALEDES